MACVGTIHKLTSFKWCESIPQWSLRWQGIKCMLMPVGFIALFKFSAILPDGGSALLFLRCDLSCEMKLKEPYGGRIKRWNKQRQKG